MNNIFRGMNLDLTNETVVRTNLLVAGLVGGSSQQLVQPRLIHGIHAQDTARVC